jgi:hypothetical protein
MFKRGRPGAIDVPAETRIVLVEGVGAARTELSGWLDASIWVRTDPDVAWKRTVAFDRDPPGFVEDWMREENAHLDTDQPWTRAAAVGSGEHPFSDSALHVRVRKSGTQPPTTDVREARVFEVSGVLFDNDGVLVDSHDVAAAVWGDDRGDAMDLFGWGEDQCVRNRVGVYLRSQLGGPVHPVAGQSRVRESRTHTIHATRRRHEFLEHRGDLFLGQGGADPHPSGPSSRCWR